MTKVILELYRNGKISDKEIVFEGTNEEYLTLVGDERLAYSIQIPFGIELNGVEEEVYVASSINDHSTSTTTYKLVPYSVGVSDSEL